MSRLSVRSVYVAAWVVRSTRHGKRVLRRWLRNSSETVRAQALPVTSLCPTAKMRNFQMARKLAANGDFPTVRHVISFSKVVTRFNKKKKWSKRGLNPRPPACKAGALPLSYCPKLNTKPQNPHLFNLFPTVSPIL